MDSRVPEALAKFLQKHSEMFSEFDSFSSDILEKALEKCYHHHK